MGNVIGVGRILSKDKDECGDGRGERNSGFDAADADRGGGLQGEATGRKFPRGVTSPPAFGEFEPDPTHT